MGQILMKGKHCNITTLSHPLSYTKTLSYPHNKVFTIFINYLLAILLTSYYLSYLLHIT